MDHTTDPGLQTLLAIRDAAEQLLSRRPSGIYEPCGVIRHEPWRALIASVLADQQNPHRITPLTDEAISDIMRGTGSC